MQGYQLYNQQHVVICLFTVKTFNKRPKLRVNDPEFWAFVKCFDGHQKWLNAAAPPSCAVDRDGLLDDAHHQQSLSLAQ